MYTQRHPIFQVTATSEVVDDENTLVSIRLFVNSICFCEHDEFLVENPDDLLGFSKELLRNTARCFLIYFLIQTFAWNRFGACAVLSGRAHYFLVKHPNRSLLFVTHRDIKLGLTLSPIKTTLIFHVSKFDQRVFHAFFYHNASSIWCLAFFSFNHLLVCRLLFWVRVSSWSVERRIVARLLVWETILFCPVCLNRQLSSSHEMQ